MKKASEYRQHAGECRKLAATLAPGEQREKLLEMAAYWDRLAVDRIDLVRRHPELAVDEEERSEASGGEGR